MLKATRHHIKQHNTRLVLKTIYDTTAVSRAQVARITHLTPPTVSAIVSSLIETHLVVEAGQGQPSGGKPPILLAVDANARHIVCVDAGNQEFRSALVNLRGDIVKRAQAPAVGGTGETAVKIIFNLLDQLLTTSQTPLLGIGLGVPGIIVPEAGMIREAVNLDWHDLPLGQLLEARYTLPVYLSNDSRAAALAEFTFGQPRDSQNLIVIKVGQGIGAGIVLHGEPFYGDGYGAGEIGQLVFRRADKQVRTLESLAGTDAIWQQAQALMGTDLTWEGFITAVNNGHDPLKQIFTEAGQLLGTAVGDLIAAYNIHHIIFSGRVTDFGDLFADIVFDAARQRVLPMMAANTTFAFSTLGTDIVLLGCAALIMKEELGII